MHCCLLASLSTAVYSKHTHTESDRCLDLTGGVSELLHHVLMPLGVSFTPLHMYHKTTDFTHKSDSFSVLLHVYRKHTHTENDRCLDFDQVCVRFATST